MKPSQIVRLLFFLTIAILFVFGIGSLLRIGENPDRKVLYIFYALVMFGDAVAMLFCVLQLDKRKKWIYYLTVFVLCLNIFPTIFDQFGLVDLLFLSLNLITLIVLIMARKEFLPV
ncbi:MAG: hypothetical protein IPP66_10015 [Anaerolineales bacterium]|nr:hypothetical protein [Anaerolineales bacterium]